LVTPPHSSPPCNLAIQIERSRSFLIGIEKYADVVERCILHESEDFFEIVFGLPGETRDERCSQAGIGIPLSNVLNLPLVHIPVATASHPIQDILARVLVRNIEV